MMAFTSMPLAVVFLILGILLPAPSVSQELLKPLPIDFCNVAIKSSERLSLEACVGPSCKPRCNGICKSRCGPSDSIGWGYCGKGCQCCRQTLPLCPYNSRCGSGGKCHSGNRCPKGEKPILGRCGFSKSCICCAPDKPTDCHGKCTTHKGSGSCKNSCGPGEERLGSCPGGKCSCCGKRGLLTACNGKCTVNDRRTPALSQQGYCTPPNLCRYKTEVGPSPCGRGCVCCSYPIFV